MVFSDEAPAKPALPESYKVPSVWKYQQQEGSMGAINRPTAGKRSDKELPVGKHELQLYSLGTPNGQKVTILLEELCDLKGVEYDAWLINIMDQEQFTSGFVAANPNSKIPVLIDNSFSPSLRVFETGNILKFLGEKHSAFLPEGIQDRTEVMNWVFWIHGAAPFLGGGFGHFYSYAPIKIEYAIERYTMETKRIVDVLDRQLEGKDFVCGEYSIADMAIYPWIICLIDHYNAGEYLQMDSYKNVTRWCKTVASRPAVARGMRVNRSWGESPVPERHSADDFKPKVASSAA